MALLHNTRVFLMKLNSDIGSNIRIFKILQFHIPFNTAQKSKNTEHCSKCIVPFDRDDSHTSIITDCWNKLSIKILFSKQWCIAAAIWYCLSFRYFFRSVAERTVYVFVYFVQWTAPIYKESGNSATFCVFFFHF